MPKVKIPRKSTNVDMTAMCDVAFLLLSFFILATKQKPPEVLSVKTPNSVSNKVVSDEAILITLTKDGRTFIMLGKDAKKKEILENINLTKSLGLTSSELARWEKHSFIGSPLGQIKSLLASGAEPDASKLSGIPIDSSATSNNEMTDWMRSASNVFGEAKVDRKDFEKLLLIKGDGDAAYPKFRSIKEAFKKNEIYKFQIVTNGQPAPTGSELYIERKTSSEASKN
jgi:biopolymer transport protein ExbD